MPASGGKADTAVAPRNTKLSSHDVRVHRTRPLLTQTGPLSGNNHAYLKSKSSSRQSLWDCFLASNPRHDVQEIRTCLIQNGCFSPHRSRGHRSNVYIWHIYVGHPLAIGLGMGTRTLALSDDDHWSVRDPGSVFAHRFERSLRS